MLNIELDQEATEQGELTDSEWEDFFIKMLIDEQLKVEESPDGKVITIAVQQRGCPGCEGARIGAGTESC